MNHSVNRNILIAEILYIIFVHDKCFGTSYPYFRLKKDMKLCADLIEVLYKSELSEEDIRVIRKGINASRSYVDKFENLCDLNCLSAVSLPSYEPLDRMKKLVNEILALMKLPFNRKKVCMRLFALHNLPRAYLSNTTYYLIHHQSAVSPSAAMKYSAMSFKE